jgi:hypothetical protein
VEDGKRRLAWRQTVCAFDPEATTFSPTMATYWPAKRERSARTKKSNSLLEAFLCRRFDMRRFLMEVQVNRPCLVLQPVSRQNLTETKNGSPISDSRERENE